MSAQWDTGYVIGVTITAAITGIALIVSAVAGVTALRSRDPWSSGFAAACAAIVAVCAAGIGTWIAFPFSGQYHRFEPEAGIVAKTGSRFLSSDVQGGGTTQKFVVTFTDGRSFGCLDTRCANVAPGDYLTLLCKRVFQFNAPSEGWDCNWGTDQKPDGTLIP